MMVVLPLLIGLIVAVVWKLRHAGDAAEGTQLTILPSVLGAFGGCFCGEALNLFHAGDPTSLLGALSGALLLEGLRRH